MTNLTKRRVSRRTLTFIALSSVGITALLNGCESESTTTTSTAGAGGHAGASAGSASGGNAGTQSSAGSVNHAGSSGAPGTAGAVGSAGSGGTAGSGGAGGNGGVGGLGGTAGGGGTGGVACAAADQCCDDPDKTAPGVCGCGTPENDSDGDGMVDCKPGHFLEAEDGVFSHVDVAVTPIDDGAGGAGAGGAGGAGGADGALPEAFTIGNDAKASKGKYIESPAGFTSDGLPGPARATYMVDIPVAKMYTFWGRFYTPSRDHNRFWVKVDDGVWTKLRVTSGETWFWYSFHKEGEFDIPIQYDLTKGAHTFAVASDSDGARIDRFYVTPGNDKPPGDATVCNPPHTIQVGDVCQSSCGQLTGNSCDAVMCAGKTLLPAYDCEVCCTL
jgi:hypothetical protein